MSNLIECPKCHKPTPNAKDSWGDLDCIYCGYELNTVSPAYQFLRVGNREALPQLPEEHSVHLNGSLSKIVYNKKDNGCIKHPLWLTGESHCLNCPIPVEECDGGNVESENLVRRKLQSEIYEDVQRGLSVKMICEKYGIKVSMYSAYLKKERDRREAVK